MVLEAITRIGQLSAELADLAEQVRASVVVVRGSRAGAGSGVLWNDRGLVVTNHHVAPGDRAEIHLGADGRLPARVTARSERFDLAALQIERELPADRVRPAAIGDSARLRVGELVVAVGNPLGERNAVTVGIVSGTGEAHWPRWSRETLQLSLALRPGNSGGALADVHGRIVGIPHMVVGSGLALAVPSRLVEKFLSAEGRGRTFIGISGQWVELPQRLVDQYELETGAGLLIMSVEPGSPAENAGLIIGDVLVGGDDGNGAGSADELMEHLQNATAGVPLHLSVIRGGVLRSLEVWPRAA